MHVLSKIKSKAAFILPKGVLSEKSEIRKNLIEKQLLSAVILLPERMFESTSISTCIMFFDKSIKNEYVTFVDCRNFFTTKIREQRGEDDVHYQRVYKKEINILSREHIEKIIDAINLKSKELDFCISIPVLQIKENDYDLMPSKYIQLVQRKELHRPFKEIVADINRCRKDKNIIKLTINETLARNLGLMDVADAVDSGNKLTDEMNGQTIYKNLGIEFEREKYLTLTKNKNEVKIEQMAKEDEICHLLLLLLPQFKHHIFYLNNRENEYLAELRDAMLPGLMDGSLSAEVSHG